MAHVCILYAVENQAFASKLERVLHEMDHAVSRREVDADSCAILGAAGGEPDAMVVIWSTQSIQSPTVIAEAREAVARRTLTPVAIGKIEPPASFQHLWPIDLSGWTGALEDPRWRFVTDEINLSIRRSEVGFEDLTLEAIKAGPDEDRRGVSSRAVLLGSAIAISALVIGLIGLGPTLFGGKHNKGDAPGIAFVEPSDVVIDAPEDGDDLDVSDSKPEEPPTDGSDAADSNDAPPDLMSVTPAPTIALGEAASGEAGALPATGNRFEQTAAAETLDVEASDEPVEALAENVSMPDPDQEPLIITSVRPGEESLAENDAFDETLDDVQSENEAELDSTVAAEAPSLKPAAPAQLVSEAISPAEGDILAETIAVATAESAPADVSGEGAVDDLDHLIVANTVLAEQENAHLGNYFRECVFCPDMAALQGGSFVMGSPADERSRQDTELLARESMIPYRFAIGTREVTYEQWDACVDAGGCRPAADPGWGRGKRPVVNISWGDAQDYVTWLSLQTGHEYRLPTEREWEYAARAGASTPFSFGSSVNPQQANFNGKYGYGDASGLYRGRTTPVASFAPNAFGLFDMHGNVWEWTSECWQQEQADACGARVLKGGAWNTGGWRLRAGHRIAGNAEARDFDNGFRVARTLP